jgi:hypothetical protein
MTTWKTAETAMAPWGRFYETVAAEIYGLTQFGKIYVCNYDF